MRFGERKVKRRDIGDAPARCEAASGRGVGEGYNPDPFDWNGHCTVDRPYGAANGLNQYPSSRPRALSYDARGNLTGDGVWTFAYSAENELIQAQTTSGVALSYVYNAAGRLRERANFAGTDVLLPRYDGDDILAEHRLADGGAPVRREACPGLDPGCTGRASTSRSSSMTGRRTANGGGNG